MGWEPVLGVLSVLSFAFGLVSVVVAIYQIRKARREKQIVEEWGSVISRTLESIRESLGDYRNRLDGIDDSVAWWSSKDEVSFHLEELRKRLVDASKSTEAFIRTVLGRRGDEPH